MDGGMQSSNSGQTPTDMEQEMLAAYRYGRPNWNANRYLCTNCGRTYSLQASLYNHKKFECGKMPNFICPYCPHRTKQKGNLKTHIKKRHPEFFSEPFMPSPSRLNSMMTSIMMQNSMLQQNMSAITSQNTPTSQTQSPMHNSIVQSSRMQNSSSNYMQNSKNPSINNLLQAMKNMPPTSSSGQSANALANANFIQALAQSLPNSTSISPLDIMQVLAQGSQAPKSPMTPHVGMSPKNTSQSNFNASQSPMPSSRMSPMNASPASTNPPQSPMAANVTPTINGGIKSELPKQEGPEDSSSEAPKSPPASNFTSLSLEPADSDDSSDIMVLPSYPVSQ